MIKAIVKMWDTKIEEVKNEIKKFDKYANLAFLPKEIIEEIKNNFELLE